MLRGRLISDYRGTWLRSEDNTGLLLSFHYVGSGDRSQVVRVGVLHLYLLSQPFTDSGSEFCVGRAFWSVVLKT